MQICLPGVLIHKEKWTDEYFFSESTDFLSQRITFVALFCMEEEAKWHHLAHFSQHYTHDLIHFIPADCIGRRCTQLLEICCDIWLNVWTLQMESFFHKTSSDVVKPLSYGVWCDIISLGIGDHFTSELGNNPSHTSKPASDVRSVG